MREGGLQYRSVAVESVLVVRCFLFVLQKTSSEVPKHRCPIVTNHIIINVGFSWSSNILRTVRSALHQSLKSRYWHVGKMLPCVWRFSAEKS